MTLATVVCALLASPAPGAWAQGGAQAGERGTPVSIFDGETLAGWAGDARFWSVEEGAIVGRTTAEEPSEHSTFLVWEGPGPDGPDGPELGDFELSFEFRISAGGNSGVQLRSRRAAEHRVTGPQLDLDDGTRFLGSLLEEGGAGLLARRGASVRLDSQGSASESVLVEPRGLRALRPPRDGGGWQAMRVEALGERLRVWYQGTLVCELVDARAGAPRRGALALQLHGGEPMEVRFRNLVLRELEPAHDRPAEKVPSWIWSGSRPRAGDTVYLRRSFELDEAPVGATLWAAGDDRIEVRLNGAVVADLVDWKRPVRMGVEDALRAGKNAVAVWARNERGPAGLVLSLEMRFADGSSRTVLSDGAWRVSTRERTGWSEVVHDESTWEAAAVLAPFGEGPWGEGLGEEIAGGITGVGALPGERIELSQGYQAELIYSVPRARQGSWVALAFDGRGRAIVSDQLGGLYRVTVPPRTPEGAGGAGGADGVRVEEIDVELGEAQGLAVVGEDLYVVVNSERRFQSGLYRVRDANRDDRYDEVRLLRRFEGSGEHGPHAVVHVGERWLYVVAGEETAIPEVDRSLVPPGFGDDRLSSWWTRDGPPRTGWIARTDLEGRRWELVAVGLRNAYDLAFGEDGELYTFDSDMEWDLGLPWYRPPRLLRVVSGADYGYRFGGAVWPAGYPDALPPALETDRASPTGMARGSNMFGRRLFAGDWLRGRILRLKPGRDGSGSRFEVESFAQGRPLPVTDLAFGPDGWLYFLTGGREVQSGLYRVTTSAPEARPFDLSSPSSRQQRSGLEKHHGVRDPAALDAAWPHLAAPDPYVRHAARVAIEHQDPELWAARALAEERPVAARESLLALVRSGRAEHRGEILRRLEEMRFEGLSPQERLALLRLHALAIVRFGMPEGGERTRLGERLLALFPQRDPGLDRELCSLLVELEVPGVIEPAIRLLQSARTQEEAIGVAFALRSMRAGWTLPLRGAFFEWLGRAEVEYEGGLALPTTLARIRRDAVATLASEERRTLATRIEPRAGIGASGGAGTPGGAGPGGGRTSGPHVRSWRVQDFAGVLDGLPGDRDLARGAEIYRSARCADCHALNGSGGAGEPGAGGPDLGDAAARYNAADLLREILEPSRTIAAGYRETEVWTTKGRAQVGRVEGESRGGVSLRTTQGELVEVAAEEIEERRPHPLSAMPEGLLDTFTKEEILDLLAFLLATSPRSPEPADDARAPGGREKR